MPTQQGRCQGKCINDCEMLSYDHNRSDRNKAIDHWNWFYIETYGTEEDKQVYMESADRCEPNVRSFFPNWATVSLPSATPQPFPPCPDAPNGARMDGAEG